MLVFQPLNPETRRDTRFSPSPSMCAITSCASFCRRADTGSALWFLLFSQAWRGVKEARRLALVVPYGAAGYDAQVRDARRACTNSDRNRRSTTSTGATLRRDLARWRDVLPDSARRISSGGWSRCQLAVRVNQTLRRAEHFHCRDRQPLNLRRLERRRIIPSLAQAFLEFRLPQGSRIPMR